MGAGIDGIRPRIAAAGQEHVLRFWPELAPESRTRFRSQLEAVDWEALPRLVAAVLRDAATSEGALEPPEVLDWGDGAAQRERDAHARRLGEELLRAGRAAAFLVAGGQGTRLGYDGPKGRFPVGPLTNRSLFAYHAQRVRATCRRYDATLPLYVMTSPANHASTVSAFEEALWFGLDPGQVVFLTQGTLPAVDPEGRLLLASRESLCLSPDGHGGCFRALQRSGALEDMHSRGIEQIFYFQVDNPLARVLDPVFLGHHVGVGAEMSTKVVEKTDPAERVGVLARQDGDTCLVEYSDLDADTAGERDLDGRLRFRAGNIAIHVISLAFARRIVDGRLELPVHRADKKVACLDDGGRLIQPREPNAIKMEMFVFDALRLARRVVTQEVLREDEFAPVKNAEGADSPATARAALSEQARRWMRAAGLAPPPGDAEVGPLFALDQEEFCANLTRADFGPVFDRS